MPPPRGLDPATSAEGQRDHLLSTVLRALEARHFGAASQASGAWLPYDEGLPLVASELELLPEPLRLHLTSGRIAAPRHVESLVRVASMRSQGVAGVLGLPASSLEVLAAVWECATGGRHGFRRQAQVWRGCSRRFDEFCHVVGWWPEGARADDDEHPADLFLAGDVRLPSGHERPGFWPIVVDAWTPMFHDTWLRDVIALNIALLGRLEEVLLG